MKDDAAARASPMWQIGRRGGCWQMFAGDGVTKIPSTQPKLMGFLVRCQVFLFIFTSNYSCCCVRSMYGLFGHIQGEM